MKPNFIDVGTFMRSLEGMTITELHATYEALAASAEPITDVSYQPRCEGEDRNFNAAGLTLDRFASQVHECIEVVISRLHELTPEYGLEQNQKAHAILHYGVRCFCDLEDIEELVNRLKRDCASPSQITEARQQDAAE